MLNNIQKNSTDIQDMCNGKILATSTSIKCTFTRDNTNGQKVMPNNKVNF